MAAPYIASQGFALTATGVDEAPYVNETGAVQRSWHGGKVIFGTGGQPTFNALTAPPAAGALTAGILLSSTAAFGVFFGSNAPTLLAAKGSLYLRTDGSSSSTRLYVATDAVGTWTAVTTAA